MWSVLTTYASGLIRKWQIWALIFGLSLLPVLIAMIRSSGKTSAKLEQLRDWSKYQAERAKDRAVIQSMRNSDVRDQLRKRWSSR